MFRMGLKVRGGMSPVCLIFPIIKIRECQVVINGIRRQILFPVYFNSVSLLVKPSRGSNKFHGTKFGNANHLSSMQNTILLLKEEDSEFEVPLAYNYARL